MLEHLGCDFSLDTMKVTLNITNCLSIPILAFIDACHNIKNVRNALGDLKILQNSKGQFIEWKYFVKLNDVQYECGLHLANRLRQKHIDYASNKMKVKLATQTFRKPYTCSKIKILKMFFDLLLYVQEVLTHFI